jgi:hypothetical protein
LSIYSQRPADLTKLKTVSLHERGGKVNTSHFAQPHQPGNRIGAWLDSLPKLLAADTLRAIVSKLEQARASRRAIIWGLGGHVIKCGLAPVLLDLMNRGFATAFAMNGAAAIHDFEIALCGATSEDVEAVLPDGRFGSAEETGRDFNAALTEAARDGIGAGEALGRKLTQIAPARFAAQSLLHQAYGNQTPATVHIAIGTDTPHTHPAADPTAMGAATHYDFRLLCSLLNGLDSGGVYINLGSAVILPEVFLKALSSMRNLGHPIQNFTTVNLDFLQHYRPRMNVVERPHAALGGNPAAGQGFSLTGHHEILVPLLSALLIERESAE